MFRLRRMYLDSVGVSDNRFADLTVELTDVAGDPTDSIVWLRNGAGKTTMLSLLLALIRPGRRDFLANKTKNRSLEDLILSGDTAHVVAEWVGPDGQLLLTGAVYEWDGRTRPVDYNSRGGKDRLRRSWWCITPDPDVDGATLDTLPFTFRTGGGFDRERFCSHISGLAIQGVNAVVVNQTIGEWHAALRERRFDPGLFEYFLLVNAAEGGIDGLFAEIDSPGKFVRYLLRFVGNHEQIEPVRDLLKDTAAEIAKRPMYLAEKEFCDDAQGRVSRLGNARSDRDDAARTLDDERLRASRHKRALLDASAVAADLADQAAIRKGIIEDALRIIRSELDLNRTRALHYLMKAAEFGVTAARLAADEAQTAAEAAAVTETAWQAVEQHTELVTRRADLAEKQSALEEKTQAAKPLQDRVNIARAHLAAAIDADVVLAGEEIAVLDENIREHDDTLHHAEAAIEMAQQRRAHLDTEQQNIHTDIAKFDKSRQRLVERGVIAADETLATAEIRLGAAAKEAHAAEERLLQRHGDKDAEAETAAVRYEEDQQAVNTADLEHRQLDAVLQNVVGRAAALADDPRVRVLMQTSDVDLGREYGDVLTALQHARASGERETFELNQGIAASERALHSLKTDGLLPPRLQVQQIVDELSAANVTAVPGWRYLAQHIQPGEHATVIAELPAVVDGVIVYTDDLAAVAAQIRTPIDDVVVLSSASVFEGHPTPQFTLGPAAAMHDTAAAAVELTTRAETYGQMVERRDAVDAQRRADDALLSKITAFAQDVPADGIDGLRARTHASAEALQQARERAAVTKQLRRDLLEDVKAIATELHQERMRAVRAEEALPAVADLALTELDVVVPSQQRLQQIPIEFAAADEQLARAREQRRTAEAAKADRMVHRGQVERRRIDWRAELETLPPPQPANMSQPEARAAREAAEQQLHQQFPEEVLRYAVTAAERELETAARQWEGHPEPVRKRAVELAASTDAADAGSRVAARQRATTVATQAKMAHGAAKGDFNAAELALEHAVRNLGGRHSRKDFESVEPTDRVHAESLAAEAADAAEGLEEQRWRREQELKADEATMGAQRARSNTLADQASRLDKVEAAAEPVDLALPADDDAVRAMVTTVHADFEYAGTLYTQANNDFDTAADELGRWASDDRFVHLAEDEHGQAVRRLREMLRDKARINRVADNAEGLVDDLRLRATQIGEQLKQVEETKANIGNKMTDLVVNALTVLRRASSLSEMPKGIGAWDHQRFLDVSPRSNPTREQIALRVGDLIDTMVSGRAVEQDPAELLWRATDAAVPEGFKATVLKPSPEQSTTRTPVADMRKWSGGENLTASLVLFCVMARLRAEKRTEDRIASAGGVLPLDNPVGKANYLPFLELQRKVAKANGVQLVYWTGIGDLGAVTTFPRIAAMHKRPSTTRAGRAYVTADKETSRQALDAVSSVRREP
ncbi:hypothetical protein [Mycobacterium sp. 29Ha]|uniref:hypothetical protein n=1 Tax=Mycobacterium sp. 29Ha TaxID=2939268 RepID=UPI00293926DE|nr:hypothetical protein [Mycobacterium sp. 29Ha]MDV3136372.1 hypothetical protein [Mycobacterium sp. 29Ha]